MTEIVITVVSWSIGSRSNRRPIHIIIAHELPFNGIRQRSQNTKQKLGKQVGK